VHPVIETKEISKHPPLIPGGGFFISQTDLPPGSSKEKIMKTEEDPRVSEWLTEFQSPERWLEPLSAIYGDAGLTPDAARQAAEADLQSLAEVESLAR
jgi:hypothetical protein